MREKLTLSTPGGYSFDPKLKSGSELPGGGLTDFQSIIRWGTTVLIIGAVVLALFFLIWGGIGWITSGGNKEKLASSQKKIVYSLIGLIISLGSFFIINFVGHLFGITFF